MIAQIAREVASAANRSIWPVCACRAKRKDFFPNALRHQYKPSSAPFLSCQGNGSAGFKVPYRTCQFAAVLWQSWDIVVPWFTASPDNIPGCGSIARSMYGLAEVRLGPDQFLHRTGYAHAALETDFIARLPCAIGKLKGRG